MEWYKTLDINQRINLKDCSEMLCGMPYNQLRVLFSMSEIIEILHNKLKIEGFDV